MRLRSGGEEGSSSITSVFGVAIFLGFLLLATQVLVHLFATSTVNAVAFDNARRAAAQDGDCAAAIANATSALGSWGTKPEVAVTCVRDGEFARLQISGPSPALGLRIYGQLTGQTTIVRGATVRQEGW